MFDSAKMLHHFETSLARASHEWAHCLFGHHAWDTWKTTVDRVSTECVSTLSGIVLSDRFLSSYSACRAGECDSVCSYMLLNEVSLSVPKSLSSNEMFEFHNSFHASRLELSRRRTKELKIAVQGLRHAESTPRLDTTSDMSAGWTSLSYTGLVCEGRCPSDWDPMLAIAGLCSGQEAQDCFLWAAGKFRNPCVEAPAPLQPCNGRETGGHFLGGKWVYNASWATDSDGSRGLWKSDCETQWLSPEQTRSALRGIRMSFHGDSMTQQLLLRLIHHARGFSYAVENIVHMDFVYAFNGTHDELLRGSTPQSTIVSPEFLASFFWDPEMKRPDEYNQPGVLFHYIGAMYSCEADLDNIQNRIRGPVVFATVPIRAGLDQERQSLVERNMWIRGKTTASFIPFQEMAGTKIFRQNVGDDTHFMCMLVIRGGDTFDSFRSPPSGDCRDMINLNAVMQLIQIVRWYEL